MAAYYNEIDPYCADWLRNLIGEGLIAPGDVDERDIRDVRPDDIRGYTQCHFFAGIGVWSYALRLAGWPDDRPVWTGSCPCQPFSAAGKRGGAADERHLWPHWFHLAEVRRPPVVFGEQVASKDGLGWLDLVSADLEGAGYAVGASDLCAAGVGPSIEQTEFGRRLVGEAEWFVEQEADPVRKAVWREFADYLRSLIVGGFHIRQRLYFTAESVGDPESRGRRERGDAAWQGRGGYPDGAEQLGGVAYGLDSRLEGHRRHGDDGGEPGWFDADTARSASEGVRAGGLADTGSLGRERRQGAASGRLDDGPDAGRIEGDDGPVRCDEAVDGAPAARPIDGLRRDADWLLCRDGKWRPVEPGTFPLAHGAPARVGRLRAYGNAIVAEAARVFIEAYLDATGVGFCERPISTKETDDG